MEFTGKLKEELLKCECREEAKKKLEDAGLLLNDEELDAVVGGGQISYSIFSGGGSGVMSASTKKSGGKREPKYFS